MSNDFELMYKHPKNVSRKFEKDGSSDLTILNVDFTSVGKWGNEQTDRHTMNVELPWQKNPPY